MGPVLATNARVPSVHRCGSSLVLLAHRISMALGRVSLGSILKRASRFSCPTPRAEVARLQCFREDIFLNDQDRAHRATYTRAKACAPRIRSVPSSTSTLNPAQSSATRRAVYQPEVLSC